MAPPVSGPMTVPAKIGGRACLKSSTISSTAKLRASAWFTLNHAHEADIMGVKFAA
jgi:hypothetical protein